MVESASPIPDAADSLAQAIVVASESPLLMLDADVVVLAASASFCRAFELDEKAVRGRHLSLLGEGEWSIAELNSLLEATIYGIAKVGAFEADLIRAGRGDRRLALRAQKLTFSDRAATRILLTITDLTEIRIADTLRNRLLHEKTILLQELQHRVANSLQIIASILMQSARRVRSEEVRSHLYEAHSRVISICTIQQHLTVASLQEVEMRSYLTELCQSIAACLISNTDRSLFIEVNTDDSSAASDVSISLGLVVTELVINALKHAFPDKRNGRIIVNYGCKDAEWTLSVSDDGVGIWSGSRLREPGLGTSIVAAIAERLSARVERTDNCPGTKVSLIRAAEAASPVS